MKGFTLYPVSTCEAMTLSVSVCLSRAATELCRFNGVGGSAQIRCLGLHSHLLPVIGKGQVRGGVGFCQPSDIRAFY